VTVLTTLLVALAALAWMVRAIPVTLVGARMLQIEEYEDARFLHWGLSRAWLAHRANVVAALLSLIALAGALLVPAQATRIIAAGWLVASVTAALLWRWTAAKRPLVMTARMRRVLGVAAAAVALVAAGAAVLLGTGQWRAAAVLCAVLLSLLTGLSQLVLAGADQALRPLESAIRRRYLRQARTRMAAVGPLVVAVAGSYGKTSTKHILAQLLAEQVETLPTRKSFNTLMGVTRVINEDLQERHRLFIVEMDAYARGEIASMCDLVHPRAAVVTSAGPQHLERFGDMDAIVDALYEVVAALPPDGTAFIHADEHGAELARRAAREGRDVVRYGIAEDVESLDVVATEVEPGAAGSRFCWTWPKLGLRRAVAIPLLGRHQVLNVTAALAVVQHLGYSLDAAIAAAGRLRAVEHRLQPLPATGAVRVIDDSYNANPVGVHDALEVLAAMNGGARVLVTPGLVELGPMEDVENRRYGEHAAQVCDHVIVMVARPAGALRAGLAAGGLGADRIHLAHNLAEATAIIGRITHAGDTVLFANDLPDTYLPA
jgi:UDP-N-acetylmuramoyl-tripeptide--D-alanyl-D-alanine ligase